MREYTVEVERLVLVDRHGHPRLAFMVAPTGDVEFKIGSQRFVLTVEEGRYGAPAELRFVEASARQRA